MNRKNTATALLVIASLTFVSCWSDDDLQVFVSEDANAFLERYQARVDNANTRRTEYIEFVTQSLERDAENPDNVVPESLVPSEFVALPNGQGFVGVADLGLSVKWAVSDENAAVSEVQQVQSFFEYDPIRLIDELTLETPELTLEVGTMVPLEQYNRAHNDKLISDKISAYLQKITSLKNNFAVNKTIYYIYLWQTKYYFLKRQDKETTIDWGEEWRTPTDEELKELATQCTWQRGHFYLLSYGLVGTAPNGRSIYLPDIYSKEEILNYKSRLVRK